jgi:hypothetical protein
VKKVVYIVTILVYNIISRGTTMYTQSKSLLAKLLANENISIRHGNYDTASFDVDNRILYFPLWKELNKDTYDLLIGHEVGHALYTPSEGWHNATTEIPGIPRSFVNIIEDIRIEKLIQRKYPGLVRSFKGGYAHMYSLDFFKIEGRDVQAMSFMNRLNLKSKLRDNINITYSKEEQVFVDMANACETWEDVIVCCRAIYNYVKEKNEQSKDTRKENGRKEKGSSSATTETAETYSASESDSEPTDGQDAAGESNSDSSLNRSSTTMGEPDDSENESMADMLEDRSVDKADSEQEVVDELDTSTDDAYRSMESEIVERNEQGNIPTVVYGLSKKQTDEMITTYAQLDAHRNETFVSSVFEKYTDDFNKFVKDNTKLVNVMAKEFETRKAAYQYTRAKVSNTGSLNMSKLHQHKLSEDIFLKITTLADAKSHGMIMLIDKSGSMSGSIDNVILQVLILSMFCKKVSIPFDVYTFTTFDNHRGFSTLRSTICHENLRVVQVLSSSLSNADYKKGFRFLFNQTHSPVFTTDLERLNGTPIVEVMTAIPLLVKRFKAKHNLQRVIVPILTDGDPSSVFAMNEDGKRSYAIHSHVTTILNVDGAYIPVKSEQDAFEKLTAHLGTYPGVVPIGYFIANRAVEFNKKIAHINKSWHSDVFDNSRKQVRDKGYASYDNVLGFKRMFIMKFSSSLFNTTISEFDVDDDAKTADITRAFKKYAGGKKNSRIFATQFTEIIA